MIARAFQSIEQPRFVAFGLQTPEPPRADVRQAFVVQVDRVLCREHDANASEEELYKFFAALRTKSKQFLMMDGMTHGGGMVGSTRKRLWHVIEAFLSDPKTA